MRVAIFAESYLPYVSGVTISTDALARGLGLLGHQVLVVAPRPSLGSEPGEVGSPGPSPRHAWLPSYQLPVLAPAGYRMPWPMPSSGGLRAVSAFRPDLVHAQSPFVMGLMARASARRLGVPLVFTHHTRFADYRHYAGALAAPVALLVEAYLRRFWTGCSAVVAPSSDLAAEIEARLPSTRSRPLVRVIPTGVDVSRLAGLAPVDPRPVAGWPSDALVVATLGRLAPEKSVELVLEAFARALQAEPRLRLLVVGGGPSEAALRARATAADLVGQVHFSGALPRGEALTTISGADLFLFTSRTETQGLVLAEALACGLPVVALEGPGVRDTVRDGIDGVVVSRDARRPEQRLADELVRLACDAPRLGALADAARAGAPRFDVALRVGEISALYEEVLRRKR